jgi:hypothetical protein
MQITGTSHGKVAFLVAGVVMVVSGLINIGVSLIHTLVFLAVYTVANRMLKNETVGSSDEDEDIHKDNKNWQKLLKWHAVFSILGLCVFLVLRMWLTNR